MGRILFIDNATDHRLYQPLEHWKPLFKYSFEVYHAPFDKTPPTLEAFTHIIISGSLSSTLEKKQWMLAEEDYIRHAVKQGKVIIGNCFGHQIIARALFGEKAVRKRDKPEIGWPDMEIIRSDALLGVQGEIINGFVLHFDEVCSIPENKADIILKSSECENLAFKIRGCPVWGIQPHFEIGIVQGLGVIDVVKGPGVPTKNEFIDDLAKGPRDSGRIAGMMREFYKLRPINGASQGDLPGG